MNEEIRSTIAITASIVVFMVCCLRSFIKSRFSHQKFIEKARTQGNYTTATLINNKRWLGNDESGNENFKYDRIRCTYEYRVNGVSYKKKLTFQSPGMVAVKYPYTITVYYDPKKPSKSVCKEDVNKGFIKFSGCLGSIAFAIITFIAIYNMLILF